MTGPSESPDRWQRLWEVFHAALERDPPERAALLDAACGGDAEFRREVDELLAAHAADGLLDQPVTPAGEPARPAFLPGDRLASRFRIVRLIGSGGMGTVYEAVDEDLRATVAIKTLHPDMARNADAIERFRRELLLARRVTHPAACRLFDLFHHHDAAGAVAFLTMELLRGETLSQRVTRTGPLPEDEASPIVEQMAQALSAAHRVGVIHRDLKSANVLLVPGEDGEPTRAVVTDFGLASLMPATTATGGGLTRTGQLLGTPAFMAPEQLEGRAATAATDIYALGLVMYEMVTGEVPFARESALTLAIKRLREPSPPPSALRPDLRPEWNAAILRCLERDPEDRFQTPEAVVGALRPGSSMAGVFIPRRYRRRVLLGALAAAVVAAAVVTLSAAGIWFTPHVLSNTTGAKLAFNERDWVLVADFENRTGEAVLDDTIRFAVERELNTSQFVNVVPIERISDALRLMRRQPDTKLTGDVAREVALRDGGIRAIVRGRIEKLGGAYVTAAELVEPASAVVVASFAHEARGHHEILASARQLSNQLRRAVGEELSRTQQSNDRLLRVTTPSLRALQLFSQGDSLIAQNRSAPAEQLLKQAIDEDPNFASGYIQLAHAIQDQRRFPDEYLPYGKRAMELADTATEVEGDFIHASYYGMRGDYRQALASYQALLQLHPDHFWGNSKAGTILALGLLRGEEAVPYFVRAAELRPNDLPFTHDTAFAIAVWGRNVAAARKLIDRAQALLTPELKKAHPVAAAWIEVFPAHDRRLSGDVRGALAALQRLERDLETHPAAEDLAFEITLAYQSLGRLRDAERVAAAASPSSLGPVPTSSPIAPPSSLSLMNAFLRDDLAFRERWSATPASWLLQRATMQEIMAVVFARSGLVEAAKAMSSRLDTKAPGLLLGEARAKASLIARAELALIERRIPEAIALFEQGLPAQRILGSGAYFLGCEGLAHAWSRQREPDRAIALLEDAVQQKDRTIRGSSGAFWLRVVWQLAKVYRQIGRNDDAAKLEAELRQLLAVADPDHPILVEMQRRPAAASVP